MNLSRVFRSAGIVVLALVVAQLAIPGVVWSQETNDVYVLGRPATTFSVHSPNNLEELKDLFDRYEADLRKVLELGNWDGNADDLFTTVRSAKAGDGTITQRSISQGETLQWMAYRKNGEPAILENPRWAAKKPYDAWQIKVDSNGKTSTFVVPFTCMNLALDKVESMPSMRCSVSASFDAAADLITITGSTDAKNFEITSVQIPGGDGNMNDLKSTGDMSWTYQPTTDGVYRFNAKAGSGKRASTCSGEVNVTREKAACAIDVTVDPETHLMTIQATGVQGEFEFAGLTLPDGSTAQIDAFENVGDRRWTFDAAESLPKKPGDYTYKFNGTATHRNSDATCDKMVVITRSAPEYRWIARGYGAYVSPTGSRSKDSGPIAAPSAGSFAAGEEATEIWSKTGTGFGFDIEFMLTPHIGIEGTALFAETETHFMYDNPLVWVMDDQNTDFGMFSLGANYHFTPASRVDFFAGAFVGFVSYDTARFSFDDPDQEFDFDFDDDVALGLNAGVDIPFKVGSPWIFTVGLNYLVTSADDQNSPHDLDLDPWIGTIGIGYRF